MFLYLPLILSLFAFHVYLIRIDFVFPFMMVNGVLIWFSGTNLLGNKLLKEKSVWYRTWAADSIKAILVMTVPIVLMLGVQYLPLFLAGVVLFVGPGSSLIGFMMNLEHMAVLLTLILPIGAWLYRLTGNISAGAMTSAMIVSWFFTTSSVLAPIPV